ncbi:flagellar biosynthesis protein FliQ [Marinobacteraceae bacterium S3BR75-40.1]
MTPEVTLDILRQALQLIVLMAVIIIGPGLIVGLIVSVFQAATQINEQTLSFLPRLLVTLGVLIVWGPWMAGMLVDFTQGLFMDIPSLIR